MEGKSQMTETKKDREVADEQDVPSQEAPDIAQDEDAGPSGEHGELPGVGGYDGLDPKTDMPRVPTAPETQDDAEGDAREAHDEE